MPVAISPERPYPANGTKAGHRIGQKLLPPAVTAPSARKSLSEMVFCQIGERPVSDQASGVNSILRGKKRLTPMRYPRSAREASALTATRPSDWERSQVSASKVIEGHSLQYRPAVRLFMQYLAQRAADCAPMCGRCRSNAHQHSRDVLRDRFLTPRSSARCARLSPMWRRHRAAAKTPRFRHTHRVVRPHDPSRQASPRKHRHGRCFRWPLACG
jgi:hypothetical protein